jgi:general secretion pathway protein A
MYNELFRLTEPPFRLTPDPQFLFASKQHSRAKAYMESTIWLADGFVVITGEIGSGKTTLIESFLAELPDDVVLAYVSQTQLTPVEFLQAVLVEFGFKPFRQRKVELLSTLKEFMVEQYAEGKTLLLIVDEAQNLSHKVLEEIRLLSGIEAQKEKPLRIVLAGQPELSQTLDSSRLEQLRQRVRLRFHLGPLSKRETQEYIQHRLDVAGAGGRRIFDRDSIDFIYRYTGGVPRLVNVLCDTALLCGFAESKDTIDVGLIQEAVDELQWVDFATRNAGRSGEIAESTPDELQGPSLTDTQSVPARFDVLFKDQPITEFMLPIGRAIVGRTADNDLQIRSRFVSRHHIQVVTDATRSTVEDLKSTNGMFIGPKRVTHHVLRDGDIIQLGEHKLVYRDQREGAPGIQRDEAVKSIEDTNNSPNAESANDPEHNDTEIDIDVDLDYIEDSDESGDVDDDSLEDEDVDDAEQSAFRGRARQVFE